MILIVAFLLSACAAKISDYYPLEEGLSLNYRIDKSEIQQVENFKVRDMNKVSVVPQKIETSRGAAFRFVAKNKEGIYSYAYQAHNAAEPKISERPEYILKNPLKVGASWETERDMPVLMDRVSYTMNYRVESMNEIVTVPAATFKKCLLLRGSAEVRREKVGFGAIIINVSEDNWYAPGIGLIKSVRKEESKHVLVGSNEKITRLISYKK